MIDIDKYLDLKPEVDMMEDVMYEHLRKVYDALAAAPDDLYSNEDTLWARNICDFYQMLSDGRLPAQENIIFKVSGAEITIFTVDGDESLEFTDRSSFFERPVEMILEDFKKIKQALDEERAAKITQNEIDTQQARLDMMKELMNIKRFRILAAESILAAEVFHQELDTSDGLFMDQKALALKEIEKNTEELTKLEERYERGMEVLQQLVSDLQKFQK